MKETIGFIGLGLLGLPVATNLVDAGYPLRVYNRTASKAESLVAKGATLAEKPADVVTRGGVVVTLVWDDAAVESLVTSDGFLEGLGKGGVHIAMSTVHPETARRLAALHAEHGSTYVDAPIFGRPEAAVAKGLWVPIAGPQAAKDRARPIVEAMGAKGIFDFGEMAGAAVTVKLAGNFLLVAATRSLGEALGVVDKCGVDAKAVLSMLTATLLPGPIYEGYGKRIVEKQPLMASPIPYKDLGLFSDAAAKVNAPTPLATQLRESMPKPKSS